jgi:hypothetical protein
LRTFSEKVQIDWPLCETFVRLTKGNCFRINFISDFVKISGFLSRIVQKFGPLLRLPIVFNVNQLQEKRTAFADTGTPRKEVSINHRFSDGRHASRLGINHRDLRSILCLRIESRKTVMELFEHRMVERLSASVPGFAMDGAINCKSTGPKPLNLTSAHSN